MSAPEPHQPLPPRPLAGPPLVATYRLQLRPSFGFGEARALVPYLRQLGVSHVYLSPVLAARAGSEHGYDVTDPGHASPALGGDAGFDALVDAVRAHGMGVVLDIVPNHMGTGADNPYWDDVLAFGRESPYARWFDVDWEHFARIGRRQLVLPVLGDELAEVLARGELQVELSATGFRVRYYDHSFPLDPRTAHRLFAFHHDFALDDVGAADAAGAGGARTELLLLRDALFPEQGAERSRGDAERAVRALVERAHRVPALGAYVRRTLERFAEGDDGRYRLEALLDLQAWRATHWRRAWRELNYRRFFDVSDLVALRAEDPAVFQATHRWVLDRVARGQVDAVRVDHPDGLRDPAAYLQRLRAALDVRRPDAHVPIFVEKILSHGESLRADWPVDGTTGYEALNALETPFVDAAGLATIERTFRRVMRLRGASPNFAEVAVRGKEFVLRTAFRPEVRRTVRALVAVARHERADVPAPELAEAVLRLAAALPVYRTYVVPGRDPAGPALVATDEDRAIIAQALERALARGVGSPAALEFVASVLRGDRPGADAPPKARRAAAEFALRFQQTSGPATAKGVEDTALYRWVPLASLNEVGGEPERDVARGVAVLHEGNAERARRWPLNLVTVTTHDTKRTADARARLDALSEHAEAWARLVQRWRRRHVHLRPRVTLARGGDSRGTLAAPDASLEYLLYQTLVGIWPAPGERADAEVLAAVCERAQRYAEKAAREAKSFTTWVDPEPAFEGAVRDFLTALVTGEPGARFRREVSALVQRLEAMARRTAWSRTVLQLLGPGTPDVYQGDELWNVALVDPDNRRDVDFARRAAYLASLAGDAPDGPPAPRKIRLVHGCLAVRHAHPACFAPGAGYRPVTAEGPRADDLVAFVREPAGGGAATGGAAVLVVAVRRGRSELSTWAGTTLRLPDGLPAGGWRDALGGAPYASDDLRQVDRLLAGGPVAVLVGGLAAGDPAGGARGTAVGAAPAVPPDASAGASADALADPALTPAR